MFRRPRAGETDEDLLKQEEALKAQGSFSPAAKVIQVNKRKTEENQNAQKPSGEAEAPRSKFAREQRHKKKKESIVDNTVLKEADPNKEKLKMTRNLWMEDLTQEELLLLSISIIHKNSKEIYRHLV